MFPVLIGQNAPEDQVTLAPTDFYGTRFQESFLKNFAPVTLQKKVWQELSVIMHAETMHALWPVSGYRSFERQTKIWNGKANGTTHFQKLDKLQHLPWSMLTPQERVMTLWHWSAYPGTSRHHWGSDFDLIDLQALANNPDYRLQLIPQEYSDSGIFAHLKSCPFFKQPTWFRPYQREQKPHEGIASEPWHWSYRPISESYQAAYGLDIFLQLLGQNQQQDVALTDVISKAPLSYWRHYIVVPF